VNSEGKIPIVVGVTGHRNIDGRDREELKREVTAALAQIRAMCVGEPGGEDTPVIMLNALAQGADMLCAEVALAMGIDVYVVLPCEEERYKDSFTDLAEREKLSSFLRAAKRVIIAPDIEGNGTWLAEKHAMSADDYKYRQTGIYIAEHSHILLALWDGQSPRKRFGCGTAEVIDFTLERRFLDRDHLFKPDMLNDSAVLWIRVRREGGEMQPARRRWLVASSAQEKGMTAYAGYFICEDVPTYLKDIVAETVNYNSQPCGIEGACGALWSKPEELDEYHICLSRHYAKADDISFRRNQKPYNLFILLMAIMGTFVAFAFMLYDDASLTFMILPCAFAVAVLLFLIQRGNKREYHNRYIKFRAFAEACRIQFYMSLCLQEYPILTNVCRLYSWTQKIGFAWIYKALQSVAVIGRSEMSAVEREEVMDIWIGNSEAPKGQLRYHNEKFVKNMSRAKKYQKISGCLGTATIVLYACIFVVEIINYILSARGIDWFWEGEIVGGVYWRSMGIIIMGTLTAASLLFSSYFGKLSFDRKAEDNRKMSAFYASAYARWREIKVRPAADVPKFVKEVAREEIVENGIWYSYVRDNSLEINI